MAFALWTSIVLLLRSNRAAISLLLWPWETKRNTSALAVGERREPAPSVCVHRKRRSEVVRQCRIDGTR